LAALITAEVASLGIMVQNCNLIKILYGAKVENSTKATRFGQTAFPMPSEHEQLHRDRLFSFGCAFFWISTFGFGI
jgi:hypothetical protein